MAYEVPEYRNLGPLISFEGVFELGSIGDKFLAEEREKRNHQDPSRIINIQLTSPHIETGIANSRLYDPSRWSIPNSHLEDTEFTNYFDVETLIRIDFQIRFCRSVLSDAGLIGYDQKIWLHRSLRDFTYLLEEPSQNLSDFQEKALFYAILSRGDMFHTGVWYAAKFLSHWRRLESLHHEYSSLAKRQKYEISAMREAMLMGETWIEAKVVINVGKNADVGRRQNKTLDDNRRASHKNGAERVRVRQDAIRELLHATSNTGGLLESWLQTQLKQQFGITIQKRTIRSDLKKIRSG